MKYILKITSWRDRDPYNYAMHFYGRIRPGDVDLRHRVALDDPNYADSSLRCATAKPGETTMTIRFISRQQVIEAANLWMKENATENDTLEVMG